MIAEEFDFCVIGAGSAGYAAATTARDLGKSVALVEHTRPLAGLCILRGCMPSKTLLRSAEIAHFVGSAPALGIEPNGFKVNFPGIMARKRRIIGEFADDRVAGIEKFPLFRGAGARFESPTEVAVDGRVIRAGKTLIATGSVVNVPHIEGLSETGYLDSDDILELDQLPPSILALGGGPVATELAQYLHRLGVKTTILQRSATLLSGEDLDVGEALKRSLQKDRIEVVTGCTFERVEAAGGRKRVSATVDGVRQTFEAAEIFLALGRRAYIDGLNLDQVGVAHDHHGIVVDKYMRTSNPHIYAAGDVTTDSWQLVHLAVTEGQIAARNALGDEPQTVDYALQTARAVFTDPQVAIAGVTERECRSAGIAYEAAGYPFDDLGKAIAVGLTEGFVKMIAALDGRILGVAYVGAEAADLIHEAIALLYFRATVEDVMAIPHLHPTLSEILTYPAEELCERLKHRAHALVRP